MSLNFRRSWKIPFGLLIFIFFLFPVHLTFGGNNEQDEIMPDLFNQHGIF